MVRLRHELRRLTFLTQRLQEGRLALVHLPDAVNFVDCFTKWVKQSKLDDSIRYLTNAVARAAHASGMAAGGAAAAASVWANALMALEDEYDTFDLMEELEAYAEDV